jgi:endoglucanase
MPEEQFELMRDILGAPSPIGLEGAMTHGILEPYLQGFMPDAWTLHRFRGNAGVVVDSGSGELTVMLIGHADKIRMQVRNIGADGKIWIDSEAFLPCTLIGHEVLLFSEDPEAPGEYRVLEGGTIEAVGAIHFSSPKLRSGDMGIKKEQLYLELQIHGPDKQQQIERLGIRAGDAILLNRKIRPGFSPDTFYGAYLDNGLGCFVVAEVARLLAEAGLSHVRFLGAAATHEEIGRMGSRVLAREFRPDVVIGVDVAHDFEAAPGVADKRFTPVAMGNGFTLMAGSVTSAYLNTLYAGIAKEFQIPMQYKAAGRDTGTDAMAAVFASIDAAAASIGFPIRNMHTISETGHTRDVLAAIHATVELIKHLDKGHVTAEDFRQGHPRLDQARDLAFVEPSDDPDPAADPA